MKKNQNYKYYLAASISLLTFIVYLTSLKNDFVDWNDGLFFENPLAQIRTWRNTTILWTHAIETSPGVTNPYLNRALNFKRRGLLDKAIQDYNVAVSLRRSRPAAGSYAG